MNVEELRRREARNRVKRAEDDAIRQVGAAIERIHRATRAGRVVKQLHELGEECTEAGEPAAGELFEALAELTESGRAVAFDD